MKEIGIACEITGPVDTYTCPKHALLYASKGDVRQKFSVVLTSRAIVGEPTPSNEFREVRWLPREEAETLTMDNSTQMRIGHFLAGRAVLYCG